MGRWRGKVRRKTVDRLWGESKSFDVCFEPEVTDAATCANVGSTLRFCKRNTWFEVTECMDVLRAFVPIDTPWDEGVAPEVALQARYLTTAPKGQCRLVQC